MFQKITLLLLVPLLLTSCSITRLRPCCRFKAGYGGFERTRNLKLGQKAPTSVAIYKNEYYIILLDKKEAINALKNHLEEDSLKESFVNSMKSSDTLDITDVKLDTYSRLRRFICTKIEAKKAVIIDCLTGEKLTTIQRRKFNYRNGSRGGRGGIEYIDPASNCVVARKDFWIS